MKLKSYSTRSTTGFSISAIGLSVSASGFFSITCCSVLITAFSVPCEEGAAAAEAAADTTTDAAEASAGDAAIIDVAIVVEGVVDDIDVEEVNAVGGLHHATVPSL